MITLREETVTTNIPNIYVVTCDGRRVNLTLTRFIKALVKAACEVTPMSPLLEPSLRV